MSTNRRSFLARFASAAGGLVIGRKSVQAQDPHAGHQQPAPQTEQENLRNRDAADAVRVSAADANQPRATFETPDVPKALFRMIDGVKEFHITADVVRTEFLPGKVVDAWGY